MKNKGLLLVVSGPSGVGKGTLLKLLCERDDVFYSVSATTRAPREGEADGVNYFFKSVDDFKKMIEKDEFLEWAEFCGNFYGTPKQTVFDMLEKGINVVLEIEVAGAMQIKKTCPDAVFIFITPPSMDELKSRIIGRGTESPDVISERLATAEKELTYISNYDYAVVNDDISLAVSNIEQIINSEKMRTSRCLNYIKEVQKV